MQIWSILFASLCAHLHHSKLRDDTLPEWIVKSAKITRCAFKQNKGKQNVKKELARVQQNALKWKTSIPGAKKRKKFSLGTGKYDFSVDILRHSLILEEI